MVKNKGKSPKNIKQLIKWKKSKEGREHHSKIMKGRMPKNFNFMRKCYDEHKKEIAEFNKQRWKNDKKLREKLIGKVIGIKGENNPNWKGGISPLRKRLRFSSKWKIWRELIFLRDDFTCQNKDCQFCKNKIGVKLHTHHIKEFATILIEECIDDYEEAIKCKRLWNINNGITYCEEFHLSLHGLLKIGGMINGNYSSAI